MNVAEPLVVKAAGVATVLTTRFRSAVPGEVPVREVDALAGDDARELLRRHVGQAVDEDPAAADVLELCERLPLFINVAGRAVAAGYYSLAEYAGELRRRGLGAVAEEDVKAAAVFDLTWEHLSKEEREAFAVLTLAPGEDVGANILRAWQQQASEGDPGGRSPARVLVELANASLLSPVAGRKGRFRFHDRVRDYALTMLTMPKDEARRQLLSCWTDWDMVKAEFETVGADGLARQYLRLRAWGVEEPADFAPWFHFVRGQASVLGTYPELFFQQAFNEAEDSPVSLAARERVGTAEEPGRWRRRRRKRPRLSPAAA
jgi:hypothetical protein